MTEKELRKLGRQELIEIMLAQEKAIRNLEGKLKSRDEKLTERRISIEESGSIAEASLRLSSVFTAAQDAADLYLENIREKETAARERLRTAEDKLARAERLIDSLSAAVGDFADQLSARGLDPEKLRAELSEEAKSV